MDEILVSSMPTIFRWKAPGYDDEVPGCSACASGYGRQNLVSQTSMEWVDVD